MPLTDPPIRAALVADVVPSVIGNDPDGFYVDEMGLCEHRARVDVAVFNGAIHGYEIKSDRDTFARLAGQAEVYNGVFDRITIVVGSKHSDTVEAHVADWWGITIAKRVGGGVELTTQREAQPNPSKDPVLLAHMLWRDEGLSVLAAVGKDRGVRSKSRYHICNRLADVFEVDELSSIVRTTIKEREIGASRANRAWDHHTGLRVARARSGRGG